jgi:tetratricopeptide (TPR) repeat protein
MMAAVDANRPYDNAWSAYYGAHTRLFMREHAQCAALAERALELSLKLDFPYVAAASRCVLGHARAQSGHASEGIGLIREGIAGLVDQGARLLLGNFTFYLAAALQRQGSLGEAFEIVEQALLVNPTVLANRPEMFRLRAELRLERGEQELAEADFRKAISLASTMDAKGWELRPTMSLARLLASQDRRDEARSMLAEIYGWFTDGFDLPDLEEARALLEELGLNALH